MVTKRILPVALMSLLLVACSKEGPTGPVGPPGPAGPGTRIVLSGTVDASANGSGQVIAVPQLNLSDFPIVAVYISDNTGAWIQCNLIVYDNTTDSYPIAELAIMRTGSITLFSDQVGNPYRIVIVS